MTPRGSETGVFDVHRSLRDVLEKAQFTHEMWCVLERQYGPAVVLIFRLQWFLC